MKRILKLFGYLHISEIKEVLEEEATEWETREHYDPYKKRSTGWIAHHQGVAEVASQIRGLKLTIDNRLG